MHKTLKSGRLAQLNRLEEPAPYHHKQPSHLEGAV